MWRPGRCSLVTLARRPRGCCEFGRPCRSEILEVLLRRLVELSWKVGSCGRELVGREGELDACTPSCSQLIPWSERTLDLCAPRPCLPGPKLRQAPHSREAGEVRRMGVALLKRDAVDGRSRLHRLFPAATTVADTKGTSNGQRGQQPPHQLAPRLKRRRARTGPPPDMDARRNMRGG